MGLKYISVKPHNCKDSTSFSNKISNILIACIVKSSLPKIESALQEEIAIMVNDSFELRKKANALLRKAIVIVETAIENGEEEAMKLF